MISNKNNNIKILFLGMYCHLINYIFLNNYLDRKTKTNIVIGDIVKVFSPTFQELYRAKIIQNVDGVNFRVFYIDFGNTEVVESTNIFELSDNLESKVHYNLMIDILFCYSFFIIFILGIFFSLE